MGWGGDTSKYCNTMNIFSPFHFANFAVENKIAAINDIEIFRAFFKNIFFSETLNYFHYCGSYGNFRSALVFKNMSPNHVVAKTAKLNGNKITCLSKIQI